MKKFTDK